MNLIEQQNILRGLADDALKGEMGGGSVPPYLVLAEVNRRKSARERYEAANAKYRANQPTVAEELMGQKMPSGIDAAMPRGGMPMGGMMQGGGGMPTAGIDAAMPQPQQAFANGGIVGYKNGGPIGYEVGGPVELMEAYNQRLSGMDEDRKMAQKMALMNIGAQIMAGRSRNTLSNVGTGLSAALPSYQQSMERLNTQEMQAMRDQIDLARQMEQDRLAQANSERQLEQSQPESVIARKRAEWVAAGRDPNDPAFQNWALGLTTAEAAPTPEQEVELKRQAWIAAGGDPDDVAGFQEYALGIKPAGTGGAAQDAFSKQFGTEKAKKVFELETSANMAKDAIVSNSTALDLLDRGAITGFGADFRVGFGKALQLAGVDLGKDEISNTEAFLASRVKEVGNLITLFGAGTGLSDQDRAYAEKAAAGNINLTEESIRKIIDINNRAAKNVITNYNATVQDLKDSGYEAPRPVQLPGAVGSGTTTTDIPWSR
jgi:hypothetical protein